MFTKKGDQEASLTSHPPPPEVHQLSYSAASETKEDHQKGQRSQSKCSSRLITIPFSTIFNFFIYSLWIYDVNSTIVCVCVCAKHLTTVILLQKQQSDWRTSSRNKPKSS